MFEMVKAVHEALHIESTWAFVLVIALTFGLMSGSVAWVVDKGYKNSLLERSAREAPTIPPAIDAPAKQPAPHPIGPAADILLVAERVAPTDAISHIPSLMFTIHNRGAFNITNVAVRATEYQLDTRDIVPSTAERLPEGKIRIVRGVSEEYVYSYTRSHADSIAIDQVSPGSKSATYNLASIQPFRFAKRPNPGEPGGLGGPALPGVPVRESDASRFYALRISFENGGDNQRYALYRVICSEYPYLLPLDQPDTAVSAIGGPAGFSTPFKLIVAHQRSEVWATAAEMEYPMQASQRVP